MTMPHLMNCDHQGEGWCLGCVKTAWEREQRLLEMLQECQLMLGNTIIHRNRLVEAGKALLNARNDDEHQAATCMMDAAIADAEGPAPVGIRAFDNLSEADAEWLRAAKETPKVVTRLKVDPRRFPEKPVLITLVAYQETNAPVVREGPDECDRCGGWNWKTRPYICGGCGHKNLAEVKT